MSGGGTFAAWRAKQFADKYVWVKSEPLKCVAGEVRRGSTRKSVRHLNKLAPMVIMNDKNTFYFHLYVIFSFANFFYSTKNKWSRCSHISLPSRIVAQTMLTVGYRKEKHGEKWHEKLKKLTCRGYKVQSIKEKCGVNFYRSPWEIPEHCPLIHTTF